MCKRKGEGLRCHSHALKDLQTARRKYEANPTAETKHTLDEAQHAYDLTPTNIRKMKEDGLEAQAALLQSERRQLLEQYEQQYGEAFEDEAAPRKLTADERRKEEARARREARVEELQEELEEKIAHLNQDTEWVNYLNTMRNFPTYSPSNQMLILLQNPDATRVAGFNMWRDKFRRQVNRGEKALTIFAPQKVTITDTDKDGKPVIGEDGKPRKRTFVKGFTTASVFDVSQTSGEPLPSYGELSEQPPVGFQADLETAITNAGFNVSYEPIQGSTQGFTTEEGGKRVVVDSSLSPAKRAAVLAHELGHIKAGHLERTSEYHTGHGGHRGEMEAEAESISYVLCRANGMSIKLSEGASSYIRGWNKGDTDKIKATMKTVSTNVKDLLTSHKWSNYTE